MVIVSIQSDLSAQPGEQQKMNSKEEDDLIDSRCCFASDGSRPADPAAYLMFRRHPRCGGDIRRSPACAEYRGFAHGSRPASPTT